VPILYSSDLKKSLDYYVNVLGFENKWEWGQLPTFGGVSKNAVGIYFAEGGQGSPGTWIAIMVDDIDDYYTTLRSNKARIIAGPTNREWGIREMLVQDPDGHTIRFGQNGPTSDREHLKTLLPKSVRIIPRAATPQEKESLEASLGWFPAAKATITQMPLSPSWAHAVIAEDTLSRQVIGCAFVVSDKAGFYYIKDVMVHPAWQGKKVGTALIQAVMDWMENDAPPNASAWLHAREVLAPFYSQFGFAPAFGMFRRIESKKN
jgi:GNAT superfamily N-acetyltransferase/catechol 2,3-dioxygenase-like lactoylglutathione lyase family enzyme